MKTLSAVIHKYDQVAAARTLRRLHDLERDSLLDLEISVIVRRNDNGKSFLQQSVNLSTHGAMSGSGRLLRTSMPAYVEALLQQDLGLESDSGTDGRPSRNDR